MYKPEYKRCGHCENMVCEKTYKEHYRLHYHNGQWVTERGQAAAATASSRDSTPFSDTLHSDDGMDVHSDRPSDTESRHSPYPNAILDMEFTESPEESALEKGSDDAGKWIRYLPCKHKSCAKYWLNVSTIYSQGHLTNYCV